MTTYPTYKVATLSNFPDRPMETVLAEYLEAMLDSGYELHSFSFTSFVAPGGSSYDKVLAVFKRVSN